MSLAIKPIYSNRRVITISYYSDSNGQLRGKIPLYCTDPNAGVSCNAVFHAWRPRKHAPHAFARFFCPTHKCYFTGYPKGYMPFGRRQLVLVSPAGIDIESGEKGIDAWNDTAFGALSDASSGRLWPLSSGGNKAWYAHFGREPYGVLRTQKRHIKGALHLFALAENQVAERPHVVAELRINLSDIIDLTKRARDGPKVVIDSVKGAEILRIIGKPCGNLFSGICRLGLARRYWGPAGHSNPDK